MAESGAVPVALDLSDAESPAVLIETATAELGDLANLRCGRTTDVADEGLGHEEISVEIEPFGEVSNCCAASLSVPPHPDRVKPGSGIATAQVSAFGSTMVLWMPLLPSTSCSTRCQVMNGLASLPR